MKKKSVNLLMVLQWVVFLPLLLPISMLTGAMEGIKKVFEQANEDIFEEKIIESM
ncbi:MAG: SNF family Na+-dependent transporter [Spirosomataceae bacterium]|jgi:SNF family Na+-dependent transporter